jgi:hypothetical protein
MIEIIKKLSNKYIICVYFILFFITIALLIYFLNSNKIKHKINTVGIEGCPECEDKPIGSGGYGVVYPYKGNNEKVVKVYKNDVNNIGQDERNALKEIRAYKILNKLSAINPYFKSIKAEKIPTYEGESSRIIIDRFNGVLTDYTGEDRLNALEKMHTDGVREEAFHNLLQQLKILHDYGISHTDPTGPNIGLLNTGYFVLADPMGLKVSPLSELYDKHIEPDAKPVLDALRKEYRYKLSKEILDLTESSIILFLINFKINPTKVNINYLEKFILEHNIVVRKMYINEHSDLNKILREFRYVDKTNEGWRFPTHGSTYGIM